MKPKPFYMMLMICCLALLASANTSSSDCKTVSLCTTEKAVENTCCLKKAVATETTKITPLNLFLFEL